MEENVEQPEITEEKKTPKLFSIIGDLLGPKLATIIFIAVCLALLVGVVFTFWANNQFDVISQPLVENVGDEYVSEDETTSWKTYSDYDYTFSIKYPEEWKSIVGDNVVDALRTVRFYKDNKDHAVVVSVYSGDKYADLISTNVISGTNIYSNKGDYVFNFKLDLEPEETLTQELKEVYDEIFARMVKTYEYTPAKVGAENCKPTGCSGQICSDEEINTTCEYSEAFACYKTAICERQDTGACGWTLTDELKACLRSAVGVEDASETE